MTYRALRCACRYDKCPDWHVSGVADVQGVHFTKEQAEAVADLLNVMEAASVNIIGHVNSTLDYALTQIEHDQAKYGKTVTGQEAMKRIRALLSSTPP